MSNSELKMVAMDEISVSKTNPRKTFDKDALKELEESVKQHGVLQPILVRSLVPAGKKSKPFELVCGERRYRAATAAGLTEIPCNIRMLTDDEAFELQIIENLERKDVHPLEEAFAFKRMIDSGRYTLEDVAAKLAKPVRFVVQRLKFNDLIDEVATDFRNGVIGVGHAILLARLEPVYQKEHFDDARTGWRADPDNPDYGTIHELRGAIEDHTIELESAPFPLDDAELVKSAGACSTCLKRTKCNPVLFEDMKDSDRCMDDKCYDKKEEAFIVKEALNIIDQAQQIILVSGWSGDAPDDVKDKCKAHNIKILTRYDDWKDFEVKGWPMKKAFNVYTGKYMDVYIKPQIAATVESSDNPGHEIELEIAKIEARASRALEIDAEKTWNTVRNFGDGNIGIALQDLDKNPGERFFNEEGPLTEKEKTALIIALSGVCFGSKQVPFLKDLTVERVNNETPSDKDLNRMFRLFINSRLNQSYGSHIGSAGNAALYNVFKEYYPSEVDGIETHFQKLADKRIGRTSTKLKGLNEKLAELKPEKPKKPASRKKTKKEPAETNA